MLHRLGSALLERQASPRTVFVGGRWKTCPSLPVMHLHHLFVHCCPVFAPAFEVENPVEEIGHIAKSAMPYLLEELFRRLRGFRCRQAGLSFFLTGVPRNVGLRLNGGSVDSGNVNGSLMSRMRSRAASSTMTSMSGLKVSSLKSRDRSSCCS